MMDDLERSLRDAQSLEPAPELRARVLAATMPLVRAADNRLDCMWFSARWRAAGVLSLLVIAGVEMLAPRVAAWTAVAQDHGATTSVQVAATAALEVGLTPAETAVVVAQAIEAQQSRR